MVIKEIWNKYKDYEYKELERRRLKKKYNKERKEFFKPKAVPISTKLKEKFKGLTKGKKFSGKLYIKNQIQPMYKNMKVGRYF